MDDERNLTYRSHAVHNYADFLFVTAGAEVKGRTVPTCCVENNNQNTIGTTTV